MFVLAFNCCVGQCDIYLPSILGQVLLSPRVNSGLKPFTRKSKEKFANDCFKKVCKQERSATPMRRRGFSRTAGCDCRFDLIQDGKRGGEEARVIKNAGLQLRRFFLSPTIVSRW